MIRIKTVIRWWWERWWDESSSILLLSQAFLPNTSKNSKKLKQKKYWKICFLGVQIRLSSFPIYFLKLIPEWSSRAEITINTRSKKLRSTYPYPVCRINFQGRWCTAPPTHQTLWSNRCDGSPILNLGTQKVKSKFQTTIKTFENLRYFDILISAYKTHSLIIR